MRWKTVTAAILAGLSAFAVSLPAKALDLPKATQAELKKLGKSDDLLTGLDRELAVPDDWVAGARKEGTLTITGTWDDPAFRAMTAPFVERYPFIKLHQLHGNREDRVIKPLMDFAAGRFSTDIIGGINGQLDVFNQAGAALDLRNLPGWSNIPDGAKDAEGRWIGHRLRYWCTAYNTELVAKTDLPKTWDDILTNPRWRGGKIGMVDRPNLWLINLMDDKGRDGTQAYMQALFDTVKPQLRKEGINALISLVIAGEFQLSMPSASNRVAIYMKKGAPIGWHCPDPVPASVSGILILNGAPHTYSAELFVNWLVSKEGQISQFLADSNTPAHKDLQTPEFVELGEQTVGKRIAFPKNGEDQWLLNAWYPLWTKAGGAVDKNKKDDD